MKFILMVVIPVLLFFGTLAAALAATGNLNAEALQRLMSGGETPADAGAGAPAITSDALGTLADQLKRREAALAERERALSERETQVNSREKAVEQQTAELQQLLQQIDGNLAQAEEQRRIRVQAQALSLGGMKPDGAAKVMEGMETREAAEILMEIRERDRGKILDNLSPEKATSVLKAIQDIQVTPKAE